MVGTLGRYAVCALLTSMAVPASREQPQAAWADPSPHRVQMVEVEPDISVEVLDWGGSGRAMVLLARIRHYAAGLRAVRPARVRLTAETDLRTISLPSLSG